MLKDAKEETHSVKTVKRERAYGNSVRRYNRYSHIVHHIVVYPRCTDRSSCRWTGRHGNAAAAAAYLVTCKYTLPWKYVKLSSSIMLDSEREYILEYSLVAWYTPHQDEGLI